MNISAIVMASGMSSRMDMDKLHLKINERYIYEYILITLKGYNFYETIVVAKDDDILHKAESLDFLGLKNTTYFFGQSESIKLALKNSKLTDGYMFFVADQPFIKLSTVEKLCNEFVNNPDKIIIPYYNGIKGNPVVFPSNLKTQLMSIEKDMGGKVVIKNNQDKIIKVNIETDYENLDIDTLDDYDKALNIVKKGSHFIIST